MVNLALDWQESAVLTAVLTVAAIPLRRARPGRARWFAPFVVESAIIAGLYTLWQYAGSYSVMGPAGATRRGETILRWEHDWHLPSEASVQRLVLGHRLLVEACNLYYAGMHFGVMAAFLVWLFVAHRDHYPAIRTTLALTTLVCLAIQLIPVAPPRLLPGFTDTAIEYGQSVYNLGLGADQLSAMPSVHVAWAVLVGWYVVRVGTGPWRWIAPLHTVITVFAVVATANHYWLDGIVAVVVLVGCAFGQDGVRRGIRWWRRRVDGTRRLSADQEPAILH